METLSFSLELSIIHAVSLFAADKKQNCSEYLKCVFFEFDEKGFNVVATTGNACAVHRIDTVYKELIGKKILIPAIAFDKFKKGTACISVGNLSNGDFMNGSVRISSSESEIESSTRTVASGYVNYKRIFDKSKFGKEYGNVSLSLYVIAEKAFKKLDLSDRYVETTFQGGHLVILQSSANMNFVVTLACSTESSGIFKVPHFLNQV